MNLFSQYNVPFQQLLLGLVAVVYWTNAFFIVYHLTRFGIGPRPKFLALVFLIGSVALFSTTMWFYGQVDIPAVLRSLIQQGPDWLFKIRS